MRIEIPYDNNIGVNAVYIYKPHENGVFVSIDTKIKYSYCMDVRSVREDNLKIYLCEDVDFDDNRADIIFNPENEWEKTLLDKGMVFTAQRRYGWELVIEPIGYDDLINDNKIGEWEAR